MPVLHPASSIEKMLARGPRRIVGAKDIWVTNEAGVELIDGTAGLWCANVGHGRSEIAEAMSKAVAELDYFHTFGGYSNLQQERLGERLVVSAPAKLRHVFFGTSGSDANDSILKIIIHYNNLIGRPQKKQIIARWGAYHGTSISSASLTGLAGFHQHFDLPLPIVHHTSCPDYYRFAKKGETEKAFTDRIIAELTQLITTIGAENIAAFFGEPILGAGGVVPPPASYWDQVQSICRENDILVVADEVVCGFGRTGRYYGSDVYGISPDMMATAKGLTSGVFPMSAAFLSEHIWQVLAEGSKQLGGFHHGYTYSGHPVGAGVANCVLDIIDREQLVKNALEVGSYLMRHLAESIGEHPNVGEIRGQGLLCAVQLVEDKERRDLFDPSRNAPAAVAEAAYRRGLIVRPLPSVGAVAFSPPLTLRHEHADEIVNRFAPALAQGLSNLVGS